MFSHSILISLSDEFVLIVSVVVQSCQQDLARMEAEKKSTNEKNEKELTSVRHEVTDLQSRNDDMTQNLVCL